MAEEINRSIDPTELHLNKLFKEVLDGLRDDIYESQQNVDMYAESIAVEGGKDLYGSLYNDALRIKGSARDRQLKFLNTFKERVATKEQIDLKKELKQQEKQAGTGNNGPSIADMNKVIEEMSKSGKLANIELNFDEEDEDDDL